MSNRKKNSTQQKTRNEEEEEAEKKRDNDFEAITLISIKIYLGFYFWTLFSCVCKRVFELLFSGITTSYA